MKKKLPFLTVLLFLVTVNSVFSQDVYLLHDKSIPQAVYSAEKLGIVLQEQGYNVVDERSGYDFLINIGGYFLGSETYIPAKDYFTGIREPVDWTYAFERQWLYYMLWGRLLYDPETPDEVFQDTLTRRYGSAANDLQRAYSLASSTQLLRCRR